jgi:hypothetical protein
MMKSRRSIVVLEGFYRDAQAIRNYALRQRYYLPYQDEEDVHAGRARSTWWASCFRNYDECPFKSSKPLIEALESAVGETIDMEHWRASYPVDATWKPLQDRVDGKHSCLWNCCFHVKPDNRQQLGDGVHSHAVDGWNSVGPDGWVGLIYLTPSAPIDGGLHLWKNFDPMKQLDWMTPAENWQRIDTFGNLFNRLILVRGDVPHSGAGGWGDSLESGRMYQTFFFRTFPRQTLWPVSFPKLGV